jgi:hypothetical protein
VVYQPESKVVHPESGNGFFARVGEAQDIAGQRAFLDKWHDLLHLEIQADPSFYITGRNYLT